ncbi:MAG: aldose 1-epimerase family protein [Mycobacterium leprae]
MVRLAGLDYSRAELLRKVGDISQVGGVRRLTLADGPGKGMAVVQFRTGSGLSFTVLPDRGMDIGEAAWCGRPLAWRSAVGDVAPAFLEPQGTGWLRSFGGGLLTTCGLTYNGAPCLDQGEPLGLHGRIGHAPAESVWADGEWEGDRYRMWVRGRAREAAVFGAHVQLTREISAYLGEDRFTVTDVVENLGHRPVEHMLLYHINLGFPLVDAGSRLLLPPHPVRPRDEDAAAGLAAWDRFGEPDPAYREQVFYHDLAPGPDGTVTATVASPSGLGCYVQYQAASLPRFVQWKMQGAGEYVLGLEPANCLPEGRARERERGTLQFLAPGERREYRLEIGVTGSQVCDG